MHNWLKKIGQILNPKNNQVKLPPILIIKPDYNFFPVGLTYVTATLERHGYSYDFIDMTFSDSDQLIRSLDKKYKIIMTGGIVGEFEEIEKICRTSKETSPSSKIILGGLLVRDISRNVLERLPLDFAVVGEAEDALPELLGYIFAKKMSRNDLRNIEGIMWRDKNNKLVSNHPRHRVDVGSRKILPSANIPTLGQWLARTGRSLPVLTGRGCYGKCTFCSPSFRRFQGRKFDDIFEEIKLFSEKLGINMINFTNEVFFEREEEILEFCAAYREKIKLPFTCALRLDISPTVLSELKKSGCIAVGVGIESASNKVLKNMQKSITLEDTMAFIKSARELDMKVTSGLMINNEGETEEDIHKTLDLHENLNLGTGLSLTIPYPGTIIYKRAVARGLISDEYDFLRSQQVFYNKVQFLPECLFIIDEAIGKPLLPNLTDIPHENFVSVMSRAYARFYRSNELTAVSLNPDASKIKGKCPKCGMDCEFDFNPISPVVRNLACPGTRDGKCNHVFQFAAHVYGIPRIQEYENKIRLALDSVSKIVIVGDPFNIKFLYAYRIFDICDRNIVAMGNPECDKIGQHVFYDGYKHVMPQSKLLDIKSLAKMDFDLALIAFMPPYSNQVQQTLISAGIPAEKIIQMCPGDLICKGEEFMGISKNAVVILHWLKLNNILKAGDAVLELGSQQINNDIIENLEALDKLAKLFGVAPFSETFSWKINEKKYLQSGMQHLPEDAPFAQKLYEHLGLEYACVDIDDAAHSIKLDMNYDEVPANHRGRYALVTNLGTTEHAANQLNAFKIIHDFTAPNGVMVHTVPFQGFSAHGFMSYSMQFFWMLCRSNLYKVIDVNLTFWNKYKVPENVFQFAKENSAIFSEKDHIAQHEFQDVGVIVVLQKLYDIDFVPPIDVANGTKTNDPVMQKRYWTVLDTELLGQFLSQGKHSLKDTVAKSLNT